MDRADDGNGSRHFVGDQQQRLVGGAVGSVNEGQSFWTHVVREGDVLVKHGAGWVGQVVHHDTSGSLKTEEGIIRAIVGTRRDAFGLCALVVVAGSSVSVDVFAIGLGQVGDLVSSVKHQFAISIPNGHGAGTVANDLLVLTITVMVAIGDADFEAAKVLVEEEFGLSCSIVAALGPVGGVEGQIISAIFVGVAWLAFVLSSIAFVGGHDVVVSTGVEQSNGVRHVHRRHRLSTGELNAAITVAQVVATL